MAAAGGYAVVRVATAARPRPEEDRMTGPDDRDDPDAAATAVPVVASSIPGEFIVPELVGTFTAAHPEFAVDTEITDSDGVLAALRDGTRGGRVRPRRARRRRPRGRGRRRRRDRPGRAARARARQDDAWRTARAATTPWASAGVRRPRRAPEQDLDFVSVSLGILRVSLTK